MAPARPTIITPRPLRVFHSSIQVLVMNHHRTARFTEKECHQPRITCSTVAARRATDTHRSIPELSVHGSLISHDVIGWPARFACKLRWLNNFTPSDTLIIQPLVNPRGLAVLNFLQQGNCGSKCIINALVELFSDP